MQITRREALLASTLAPSAGTNAVPLVPFGSHKVSRLIVGGNPVSGNSHVSRTLDAEMSDYFTAANIKKMLRKCEAAGINAWQSRADRHIIRLLREYRNEGGKIQWIAQTASEIVDVQRNLRDIAAAGAIGAYHHGNRTDTLWYGKKMDELRDHIKRMRDLGLRAGVGTHNPQVIDFLESKDWGIDFYMTCLYNLTRPKEDAARLKGGPLDGEFFHDADREKMLERVRRTTKQCLIFKLYGATRKCDSEATMKGALAQAFRSAKQADCAVIGMFPKSKDQVAQNCDMLAEVLARQA